MNFKDVIITRDNLPLEQWFRSQSHVPFDLSTDGDLWADYLFADFLEKIEKLYYETYSEYYWFSGTDRLVSDCGSQIINEDYVRVCKNKVRQLKIENILT
jgi:hypothetical protein